MPSSASQRLLLAASASMGIGMALLYKTGTAVGARLFMSDELAHPDSVRVERALALVSLAAVMALFARPTRAIGAGVLAALALLLAWATVDQGGVPFSEWAWPAHAMRIAAPVALLWSAAARGRSRDSAGMEWLVRLACSAVFVVHGLEAMRAHPWFVDLTISAARETIGLTLRQPTVERLLVGVGVVDIAATVHVLARGRAGAWYMAIWGSFTALLRVLAYGPGAVAETIVRLPHGLLPLMLLGRPAATDAAARLPLQPPS